MTTIFECTVATNSSLPLQNFFLSPLLLFFFLLSKYSSPQYALYSERVKRARPSINTGRSKTAPISKNCGAGRGSFWFTQHRNISRFPLASRWLFRAAGTADRREETVIPEHFSPYKCTPYNIVIQIPTVASRCIRSPGLLVTPPLWDIAGAEHRSRWGYTRKRHDALDNGVIGPRLLRGSNTRSEIFADTRTSLRAIPHVW